VLTSPSSGLGPTEPQGEAGLEKKLGWLSFFSQKACPEIKRLSVTWGCMGKKRSLEPIY
jgi:hypothetical protein